MRTAPRRVLALDEIYKPQGGIADYVLRKINAGARVQDLAAEFTQALGENVGVPTLYGWIDRFRGEKASQQGEQNA